MTINRPRFRFTDLDQWPEIHRWRTEGPGRGQDLTTWIHMQHVVTPYEEQLSVALDKLSRRHVGTNECWLAISGTAHLGKSEAITNVLIERAMRSKDQWRTRTPHGYLRTPYIYVEATSKQEARGLLASIARACGVPDTGDEKELHRTLSRLLVLIGTLLIIVDDGQMYRRVSDSASRLTDGLRHLLHLPVPMAYVGIDLEHSALLRDPGKNNDTVQQLQRRHLHTRLSPLGPGQKEETLQLVRRFAAAMKPIDDLRLDCLRDPRLLRDLAVQHEGRPGSIIHTLKCSVDEALADNRGVLTEDHVRAEIATTNAYVDELRQSA